MGSHIRILISALCLAGFVSVPAFADVSNNNTKLGKVAAQTKYLQSEINKLQKEIQILKQKPTGVNDDLAPTMSAEEAKVRAAFPSDPTEFTESRYYPFDPDLPGQAFVSTGPYIGARVLFSGSNLIVNSPSVNLDVILLNVRRSVTTRLNEMINSKAIQQNPFHSHLLLSGVIEAQAFYLKQGGQASRSGIDLTSVNIDGMILGPSPWTLGFFELSYQPGPPAGSSYTVSNSSVYVNKAFITIGDLTKSPFYGTAGQYYVPFGVYSSVMVSDNLPRLITRTKARAITLGFDIPGNTGWMGSAYIFRGDSYTGASSRVNNGGLNLNHRFGTEGGPITG